MFVIHVQTGTWVTCNVLTLTRCAYFTGSIFQFKCFAFSALTLLVGLQEGHPACKTEWCGADVVICLEQDADLHMAQLMPLPLIVSCFSKKQIGFTFLVPAHPGSPGKRAVKWVCVCVLLLTLLGCGLFLFSCAHCIACSFTLVVVFNL